ncbi:MAG: PAS domain-containing protein, partial [Sediminispirochaetaceae bacterium]
GRPLAEVFRIVDAGTRETRDNPVERVLREGVVVGLANHTLLLSAGGAEYQIADSAAPIVAANGQIEGVVLVFRDVSEEYRIREELKRNEDRLSKVLIAANDGTWDWNLTTNEVYYDPRYYEMAGYEADEFPHTLEEFQKRVHPDDVDSVMGTADRHLKGEIDRFEVEFRFAVKGGGWMWIFGRGVIVERAEDGTPTRFVGTHTDISQRKEIEENLRTERRRLAAVLEGTNVGSWEWNVQTGELLLNERWADIIGYTLEEISPISLETWLRFVHPDDLEISNDLLDRHFRGEIEYYECEARMRHKDGRWVWVLDRGKTAAWTEDGKPLIISGTHQDITERKLAEQKLQDALREKDNLLMELQHRVKNSFGMIISMLNLKSGSVQSKETKETLSTITTRVRALSELYNLLYKAESLQDVRLDEYCARVVESMRHLTEGIEIRTEMEKIIVPIREAATVGLIITELVTNAINHAYHKTGRGTVHIRLGRRDDRIVLKVSNEGCTLPNNFSIDSSSGMGLQLVQALAQQHQGDIRFERGKRTTVTVELVL